MSEQRPAADDLRHDDDRSELGGALPPVDLVPASRRVPVLDDEIVAALDQPVPSPPPLPAPQPRILRPAAVAREQRQAAVRRTRRLPVQKLDKPLSLLAWFDTWLALRLRLVRDPVRRGILQQRLKLHQRLVRKQRAARLAEKEVDKEAAIFHDIIVACWSRLGYAHVQRRRGQRLRVHRVKIERIEAQAERIYFKILTTRRTPLRWRNAMPVGVRVADLIDDETLFELSTACQRRVSSFWQERKGAWVIVDRLQGVGGLPRLVRWREVLEYYPDWDRPPAKRRAMICLGIVQHRDPEFIDLSDHPHILVGGETGAGKSNMVNVFICSLIARLSPAAIRLVLVDFKRVELAAYTEIPHLACGVIKETNDVLEMLGSLVALIDERMRVLEGHARNIDDWNRRYSDRRIPRVLIVIDEFAELMLGVPKEVRELVIALISRITNLGRAAGVHALVCTQRPAVEVVPGAVKYNMPLRIAGQVATPADSNTILGVGDAARMDNVEGRMVVKMGAKRFTVQTPFVRDEDIRRAVKQAREMPEPEPLVLPDPALPLVYNRPALLRQVVDPDGPLAGSLAVSRLTEEFGEDGMTRAKALAFVAWVRNVQAREGSVSVDDRLYEVVKRGTAYELVPVIEELEYTLDEYGAPPDAHDPGEYDPVLEQWREIRQKREAGWYDTRRSVTRNGNGSGHPAAAEQE